MVNFLMDPTGDIPWDEDPTAVDVVHIDTEDVSTVLCICQGKSHCSAPAPE